MRKVNNLPINGIIESLSAPIEHVEPGMFFHFDGKTLSVYPHDPLSNVQIMDIVFNDMQSNTSDSPKEDILINGSIRPSAENVVFHVSRRPGIKNRGIYFGVVAYWIIENGCELKDVSVVRFSGLCVESFCPMTNVQIKISDDCSEIMARTSSDNSIDLGTAIVNKKELPVIAETYWTYDFCEHINFESRLICKTQSTDYELLKSVYTSFASALRFCLGRGNVDFLLELCVEEESGFRMVGEFVAMHRKTYIPDELDEPSTLFVRAKDIKSYFGKVVSAFSNSSFCGTELSQSREDANIITYSKVIELTSAFEREFRELFPEGVKHRAKTQRDSELARSAICEAAEGLASEPKRILLRLSERVSEDNLETRIRYACKSLTDEVAEAVFRSTGANRKYTQLGKKITELRNDIAHGNESKHELRSIVNEYRLLINLVFAMRLIRLQIPNEDVARLMRCKS